MYFHNSLKFGNKKIGDQFPTYIIAEIGLNHNGDISLAKQLIDKLFIQAQTP